MQVVNHTIGNLFDQLGLDSSEIAIAEFILQHRLADETSLKCASFWSKAQRQFINESWHEDSDWCVLIDQLNLLLHTPH